MPGGTRPIDVQTREPGDNAGETTRKTNARSAKTINVRRPKKKSGGNATRAKPKSGAGEAKKSPVVLATGLFLY